ncbi:PaaX family transcriptional regulator C-terminal domain-containing protein [Streptomyces sp. NPDC085932]|uniref:PaaX family transcriptional regulator n=1 Tax=Streptomyces sp. NPDC085932 TaxID=3365741 RepID=UPI0037CF8C61
MATSPSPATSLSEVDLPREQAGTSPQHLLLTLLGDYWFGRTEHLPSAALVSLLQEFGITSAGARSALSRLTRRGLLEVRKSGRRTAYRLTPRATELLIEGRNHIINFVAVDRPWDGQWTMVAFSVPEENRHTRHALRTRLRWLGCAPLYDGLWVSPRDCGEKAVEELRNLDVHTVTVFRGRPLPGGPDAGQPLHAWDLEELRTAYEQFIGRFSPILARAESGQVSAAEALRVRTHVMDTWRTMPSLDPELPVGILPGDWPRAQARNVFVRLYDALAPLAELRVRQLIAPCSLELSALVHHHVTSTVTQGVPDRP